LHQPIFIHISGDTSSMRHYAKTSLALALSLALQLPMSTTWAEESKAVEPAKSAAPEKTEPTKAEPAKASEAAKAAEPTKAAESVKTDPAKAEATKAAQEAVQEAEKQGKLMERFQVMLEEGVNAENPPLKAAADKMAKILDNPTPPSIEELDKAMNEFKTAKGTLSPEDAATIDGVGDLLRDILKKIAEKPAHQEKAPAAPSESPAKSSDTEEKAPAKSKAEK